MKEYRKIRISRAMSVGAWCERVIFDLRNPSRLLPTSNWQVYASLLNRLKEEGAIIDMPVRKVSDATFRRLIRWLLKERKGVGFLSVMKVFTALINRARRARLTRYRADFPYRDFAPRQRAVAVARSLIAKGGTVRSLSPDEWRRFMEMDVSALAPSRAQRYWYGVYRDFVRLLYLLKSRPIDVLRLHADNFAVHPLSRRMVCSYVPAKKVNQNAVVVQFLSEDARALVEGYLSRSRCGWVFPFRMNGRCWQLSNPAQYAAHYSLARSQLAAINAFLRKVGVSMSLPFPFTLYAVRRTAITHALMENRIPLTALASMAGTSVRMIERHYTNFLHTLSGY